MDLGHIMKKTYVIDDSKMYVIMSFFAKYYKSVSGWYEIIDVFPTFIYGFKGEGKACFVSK